MPVPVGIFCVLPAETTTGVAGLRLLFSSHHCATIRASGIGAAGVGCGDAACTLVGIVIHTRRRG